MRTDKPMTSAIVLLILGTAFLLFGIYFCLKPELYRATCRIRTHRDVIPAIAETNGAYDPYFIQTEFEVIQSEVVLDKVITALDLNAAWAHKPGNTEKLSTSRCRMILRHQLDLSLTPDDNLIAISICSDDKAEAAKTANAIAEAYHHYRQTQRKERTLATVRSQEAQLNEAKEKIKKLEEESARLQSQKPEPVPAAANPVIHNDKLQSDAEAEYLKQENLLNELRVMTPEELRQAIPALAPDEVLSRLLQDLTAAQSQLITLGQTLDETDPELQRATLAVANLDTQIDERVKTILQGMQTQLEALKAAIEKSTLKIESATETVTNTPADNTNGDGRQKIRLAYELRELQKTVDMLELRLGELPVIQKPQVEIVSPAEPPARPVFPNHATGILLLFLAFVSDGTGLRLLARSSKRTTPTSAK
jgi:uncharacterized protein involved in exopolysaccharide biosynthesis